MHLDLDYLAFREYDVTNFCTGPEPNSDTVFGIARSSLTITGAAVTTTTTTSPGVLPQTG